MTEPGIPTSTTAPRGRTIASASAIELLGADAVEDDVGAASELRSRGERSGRTAHRPGELVGLDDEVGPEVRGQRPLLRVLGSGDERLRCRVLSQRGGDAEPERARAEHRDDRAGFDVRHDRVHRTRCRLDHDRGVVAHVGRHRVELRLVGDHERRPAAARVAAEAGLQPWLDVPERDALAVAEVAACARGAEGSDASRDATEHWLDDDARVVVAVGDDLVTGHEGERHDRVEVPRRSAVHRREVAAADAREARPDAFPTRTRKVGRIGVDEAQRTDPSAAAGQHLARHARGGIPRNLPFEEQRLHG